MEARISGFRLVLLKQFLQGADELSVHFVYLSTMRKLVFRRLKTMCKHAFLGNEMVKEVILLLLQCRGTCRDEL